MWRLFFYFLYSIILTLSPAVREQTWNVHYRWSHWIGFAIWIALFFLADRFTQKQLPDRDPFLLPLAALLSGWGLLTIWRLDSTFGIRQSIWLIVSVIVLIVISHLPTDLSILRRYKYILLTSGLVLTALTILLGTNPEGLRSASLARMLRRLFSTVRTAQAFACCLSLRIFERPHPHPLAILSFTPSHFIRHRLSDFIAISSTRFRHRLHFHFDLHHCSLYRHRQTPSTNRNCFDA